MRNLVDAVKWIDTIAVYVAGAGVLVLVLVILLQWIKKQKSRKLIGLKRAPLRRANGIIFGKKGRKVIYSPAEFEGHILSVAGTGQGKTTTAVTTLREWIKQKPEDNGKIKRTLYCIDISGDIETNCPNGQNKLIYEPLPPEPDTEDGEEYKKQYEAILEKMTPYNIFGSVDAMRSEETKNEALEQLSILIMPELPNMNDNARFFLVNGRKILLAALIAYYHAGLDFPDICEKILQNSFVSLFEDIDKQGNKEASVLLNGFYKANETNTAGCLQQCQDAITLFGRNQSIKRSLRRPKQGEVCIEPKMLETHNVFLRIPEDRLEMLAPLMRIISADIMNYILVRKVTPDSPIILVYWDEFGSLSLSEQNVVLPGLRRARKHGARIWILTQGISDFEVLYGKAVTRSILSNIKYKLLLGGLNESETQQFFAELLGHKKTVKKSITKNAKSVSETDSEQREYIIEPADFDKQGKEWAILLAAEEKMGYLKLKKLPYYKC